MNIAFSALRSVVNGLKIPHTTGSIKQIQYHSNSLGIKTSSRSLNASFVFDDCDSQTGANFPAVGQQVDLFVRNFFGFKTYLASATTNADGKCLFTYDCHHSSFSKDHRLLIELKADLFPSAYRGFFGRAEKVTEQTIELTVAKNSYSIETDPLLLSYANQSKNLTQVQVPPQAQRQSLKYYLEMGKAGMPEIVKALFVTVFQRWLTGAHVQSIYDSFGPKHPKIELTPGNLIYALQNQICAVGASKTAEGYTWKACWDQYEFDRDNSLPNVEVYALLNQKNQLELDRICIQYRGDENVQTVTAHDHAQLPRAIYIALSTFGLKGEAEHHLAEGHILPGIAAPSFFKYIKKENPLFKFLAIHFLGIQSINYAGSLGIIFGENSSLEASALTANSIAEIIITATKAKADWKSYHPNEPIGLTDHFASAEKRHFEILLSHYRTFINANSQGIHAHWLEIYRWSEAIHAHLPEIPKITENVMKPTPEDCENLAKFLAWIITKVTFIHWAMHSRQHLFADIRILSAAAGKRCLDNKGQFAADGNTSAADANKQLLVTRTLLNYHGDRLVENAYGDIDPLLIQELLDNFIAYEGYADILKMYPNVPI